MLRNSQWARAQWASAPQIHNHRFGFFDASPQAASEVTGDYANGKRLNVIKLICLGGISDIFSAVWGGDQNYVPKKYRFRKGILT